MSGEVEHPHRPMARVLGDWGSSRLRAFLEIDGIVTAHAGAPGIAMLGRQAPTDVLRRTLAPWRASTRFERIVLCGMAGSRTGVAEVPYVRAPATASQWRAAARAVPCGEDLIRILPGVQAQNFRDVQDVMRGEETQIFGAARLDPSLAEGRRMMLLPGTHSKWAEVRDGRIARLQTYVTGELFELLCSQSSLFRLGGTLEPDEEAFDVGVRNAVRYDLAANLFEARSAQLIEGRTAGWSRSLLSGLLIGAEVHSMLAMPSAPRGHLTLIGDPQLTDRYRRALAAFGADAQRLDGDACVLAGLRAAADDL